MTDDEIDAYILSQLPRATEGDGRRSKDIPLLPGMTLDQKRASLARLKNRHKARLSPLPPPYRSQAWRRIG